jgi:4-hydroxy-3-methylbut-2-enyl diphosphate reductase
MATYAVPAQPSRQSRTDTLPPLTVLLASPRGFCAGVVRAIAAVDEALERFGAPVYVRRPIVHNRSVVSELTRKGAVFVEELGDVPEGATVLFSAHGVAPSVKLAADRQGLKWFDAVCPLVRKVHLEVIRHHREGRTVLLIGHADHPEIEGTIGHLPADAAYVLSGIEDLDALVLDRRAPVAYAVQTTYSVQESEVMVAAILTRFDDVSGPTGSDICYATTNRQAALRAIAARADAVIVAGAAFSSNANRLADVARRSGCASVQLVETADELDLDALDAVRTVALTAAASTPEASVQAIIERLGTRFSVMVEQADAVAETTQFRPMSFA